MNCEAWTRIVVATKIRISVFRFLDAENIFTKSVDFLRIKRVQGVCRGF